jgi:pyruvate/2-oxoglutarate dehydrogenase complex dihydrolipoamide dehydrogenase (E3) component
MAHLPSRTTIQIDPLVIGSVQADTPLVRVLATSGRRTVLVETEEVGGTCVNLRYTSRIQV